MAKNYDFKLDDKGKFRSEIQGVMRAKVTLALPTMQGQMIDYINKVIINKGINRSTELVSWVYSKEGLGFLGWPKPFAVEQIAIMKEEMTRTTETTVNKLSMKFGTSDSGYLESSLRALVERRSLETGEQYFFLENWYEWITKGYVGDSGFRVFYQKGRGRSKLASMVSEYHRSWNIAKDNSIVKLKNPAIESFEKNKDKTIKRFRKIIIDTAKKAFK